MKQNSIDEITIKSSGEINPKTGTNTRIPYEHQKNAMACLDIINKEKHTALWWYFQLEEAKHIRLPCGF